MAKIIFVWRGLVGEAERNSGGVGFVGRLTNASEEVTFQGHTLADVQVAFKKTAELYSQQAKEVGHGSALFSGPANQV